MIINKENYKLYKGDCLEVMDKLIEEGIKVDAIICDLPYGTTACKWDSIIPFDKLWDRINKLINPNGNIVLFGSEPFSSKLRMSNLRDYKYDWIWKKSKCSNFPHAKNMPLKFYENIIVFSKGKIGHKSQLKNRMTYNPQGLVKVDKKWSRPRKYDKGENGHGLTRDSHKLERVIEFENYPSCIIEIGNSNNKERTLHPTQKPLALMEYLIKTYTNENETILDFTMGSGSTGVACLNTNRRFVGIELDEKYFNIAKQRLQDVVISTGSEVV
ncbi:MAG: site-specific DNA-methyltransferase [Terrisporobacter othiniensis]|nr:site-specific DNA-methyltransferase [Terrisporobacter othiniensis]